MADATAWEAVVDKAERAADRPAEADNPYLRGNYAPVSTEETAFDLPVTGEIPAGLNGMLLRDGPNPAGAANPEGHWFLGDGMVHSIGLAGGKATSYRNRWIRTPQLEASIGLESAPMSTHNMGMGTGNVNVIEHGGKILGLGEVDLPFQLDAELNTVGQYDFGGALTSSMTAHPKVDPVTGELLFFGYTPFGPPFLNYYRADRSGTIVQAEAIDLPQCTMIHDWGVTESRVVFMDLPVIFDMDLVAQGKSMPFRWDDDTAARIGVMGRTATSKDVVWIDIDPCYVFHTLNTYDDGDRIVMDVVRYPKMFATNHVGPHEPVFGSLHRWEIDPSAGVMKQTQLDDRGIEFPRMDPRLVGHKHRYGYATEIVGAGGFDPGEIVRYDLETGTSESFDLGAGRLTGEAIFVPESDSSAEGEGWLLSVVYDAATDKSDVVILRADDLSSGPVATVHLPVRVPFGFHGNWVDTAALA